MMANQIPSPTNWPQQRKKSKLRVVPIDAHRDRDALAALKKTVRFYEKPGAPKLMNYIAAFTYREKDGTVRVHQSARGLTTAGEQLLIAEKLRDWIKA